MTNNTYTAKPVKTDDGGWMLLVNDGRELGFYASRAKAYAAREDVLASLNAQPVADDTDGWEELSTEEVADMSEVFAAQEEADALAEQEALEPANEEHESVLADLRVARDSGDRNTRRDLIKQARAAGIKGQDVADAAGVSITYVYDVANGTARSTPALREYQKGYQSALADVLALSMSGKTRDESLLLIEEWIENNRLTAAASIFTQTLTEHGVAA